MELSKLSFGFTVIASFISGAIVMSFYQSDSSPQVARPEQKHNVTLAKKQQPLAKTSISVKPITTDSEGQQPLEAPQIISSAELEHQVKVLKQQLASQQAVIEKYQSANLEAPSTGSRMAELSRLFEQQARDETWAYQVETAMADFLVMADLPLQPDVSIANCKSSVCQFKLVQPDDVDALPKHYWRNMNDKLVEQSWWKQFKFTNTISNDESLTILVSTE